MRQFKDNLLRGLLWLSAFLSVAVLVMIVGFIFYKGFRLNQFRFHLWRLFTNRWRWYLANDCNNGLHNRYFIGHCNTHRDISGRLSCKNMRNKDDW